jgi:glycosyltransferase involved in cell wall biosynthesis
MIVKNEELVIGRCLESVKDLVDEIIIVDTGSTDKTKEIVSEYTDKIYDFEWGYDFSAARNFSFSKATKDFIFWLDADDIIMQKDRNKFLKLKQVLTDEIDVVMLKYNVEFDETGKPSHMFQRERIFRRNMDFKWEGRIHEAIKLSGNVINSDVAVSHKPVMSIKDRGRNLTIFEKMIENGVEFTAREQNYYAVELEYNSRYEDAIVEFEKYLAREDGWLEQQLTSCQELGKCYKELGDEKMELYSYFRSFDYDVPRSEICCDIGKYFYEREKHQQSIEWYKIALENDINDFQDGYRISDAYDIIPAIHLCASYEKLGEIEKSIYYHEMTKKFNPNHPAVIRNNHYFESLKAAKIMGNTAQTDLTSILSNMQPAMPINLPPGLPPGGQFIDISKMTAGELQALKENIEKSGGQIFEVDKIPKIGELDIQNELQLKELQAIAQSGNSMKKYNQRSIREKDDPVSRIQQIGDKYVVVNDELGIQQNQFTGIQQLSDKGVPNIDKGILRGDVGLSNIYKGVSNVDSNIFSGDVGLLGGNAKAKEDVSQETLEQIQQQLARMSVELNNLKSARNINSVGKIDNENKDAKENKSKKENKSNKKKNTGKKKKKKK